MKPFTVDITEVLMEFVKIRHFVILLSVQSQEYLRIRKVLVWLGDRGHSHLQKLAWGILNGAGKSPPEYYVEFAEVRCVLCDCPQLRDCHSDSDGRSIVCQVKLLMQVLGNRSMVSSSVVCATR